jgi:chaperonin GroES
MPEMNVIRPLNKKVVVEPEAKEKVSTGGIVIPETANQKAPTKGRVLAIASDSDLVGKLSVGDLVLFSKFSGVEIVIPKGKWNAEDRIVQIMSDEDLLAVLERVEVKNE